MNKFFLYLATLVFVFILDMLWLGGLAKSIYRENIGFLLRKNSMGMAPNWPAAAVVYIAIATGIIYFVLPRAHQEPMHALFWGMLFGAVTYGIYDFTNFSILANWPFKITVIDFIWGIILCGISSLFAAFIWRWIYS